jgi:hypothetical protein
MLTGGSPNNVEKRDRSNLSPAQRLGEGVLMGVIVAIALVFLYFYVRIGFAPEIAVISQFFK